MEIITPIVRRNFSPIIWGIWGAAAISLVFYLVQVLGMQSWSAPLYFMANKWYFVLPLVFGFAIQVGLVRAIHLKAKQGGGTLAASGGVSTTAMIACCLHNFVTLLPIIGLSGAAIFLAAYQDYIFSFSILFVISGTIYMRRQYQKLHTGCQIDT